MVHWIIRPNLDTTLVYKEIPGRCRLHDREVFMTDAPLSRYILRESRSCLIRGQWTANEGAVVHQHHVVLEYSSCPGKERRHDILTAGPEGSWQSFAERHEEQWRSANGG